MMNPDSTKKTWTPSQPDAQAKDGPPKWNMTTATAAMTRTPSRDAKRRASRNWS